MIFTSSKLDQKVMVFPYLFPEPEIQGLGCLYYWRFHVFKMVNSHWQDKHTLVRMNSITNQILLPIGCLGLCCSVFQEGSQDTPPPKTGRGLNWSSSVVLGEGECHALQQLNMAFKVLCPKGSDVVAAQQVYCCGFLFGCGAYGYPVKAAYIPPP